jgi:hypothetical protein
METTVASTIWKQIPIGVKMACGAREPSADTYSLCFKVLNGSKHRIKVTLNGSDLYDVELFAMDRKYNVTVKEKACDVYCEMLGDIIYSMCNK